MMSLLALFRDLMLMRRGPQDLPYSPGLLGVTIFVAIAIDLLVSAALGERGGNLAQIGCSNLAQVLFPYVVLMIHKREPRFVQTATALVAIGALMTLLGFPFVLAISRIPQNAQTLTPAQALQLVFVLVLLIWSIAATARVFRHALESGTAVSVIHALSLFFVQAFINSVLDTPAATTGAAS